HRTHASREIHNHISRAVHGGSSIYALDQDLLERLNPDLILTQELCDVCAVSYDVVETAVQRLEGHRRILSLEPTTLGGILVKLVGGDHAPPTPVKLAVRLAAPIVGRRLEPNLHIHLLQHLAGPSQVVAALLTSAVFGEQDSETQMTQGGERSHLEF